MAIHIEISKFANDRGVTEEFIKKFTKSLVVDGVTFIDQEAFDEALGTYSESSPKQKTPTDEDQSNYPSQTEANTRRELIKKIVNLVEEKGHRIKELSLYTNLYGSSYTSNVYAQLHEVRDARKSEFNGICVAIPDAEGLKDIPPHPSLRKAPISILKGERGPNKAWLRGGLRGIESPALVLLIPVEMYESPKHEGWQEIEKVLEYAHNRRAKSSWSVKL